MRSELMHADARVQETVKAYRAAERVYLASPRAPSDGQLLSEARMAVLLQEQARRAVQTVTE